MPARKVIKPGNVPVPINGKPHFSLAKIVDAARQEATGAKTSSYLITTAVTGLVYAGVTLIFLPLIPVYLQLAAWLLLSFLFAITFSPLRYGMEELIRQLFPGTDYDSHLLVKYLNTISYSSLTLNDLSRLFFEAFASRFDVAEAAFVFFTSKTKYLMKTSDQFQNLQSLDPTEITFLTSRLIPEPVPVKHLKDSNAHRILETHHIKLLLPLTNNDQLVGLLFLGSKYTLKPYTTKDHKVLTAIAPKIGFAIKNAFEYERLKVKNDDLITELRETNEKLRGLNRQLKHDDKLKDEFVYVATHELKNPITAMRGYLSLIDEGHFGQVPDKLKNPISQINVSNQQLIGLLNNLLQIARAEAQKLDIKTTPVIICDVIDVVVKDLNPLIEQKHLTIKHECRNPSILVMADKERLREIISNLLSNAIKYSNSGVIEITHTIDQDKLVTHIADQGVGIPETEHPKIFSRFFRVEEEAAKGIPGTGLGLFIVKQLLEKMQGKIWFVSRPNHGSTFSFSLGIAHTYHLKSAQ